MNDNRINIRDDSSPPEPIPVKFADDTVKATEIILASPAFERDLNTFLGDLYDILNGHYPP